MLYKHPLNLKNKNDSAVILFDYVRPETTVLDAGCACGNLGMMLSRLKNCKVTGLEYNPQSAEKALATGAFEKVETADLNSLGDDWLSTHAGCFDYIIFGDVLEHLLFPSEILNKFKTCLKPEGEFLISLPNVAHASIKANLLLNQFDYTEIGILDKTHLHFYTAVSIARLLADNGLLISELKATTLPADGYQKFPVSDLPPAIADFILSDPQSLIMQFVFRCKKDPQSAKILFKDNIKYFKFTQNQREYCKQGIIFKLKRLFITRFPKLLKYLETLR